MPCSTVDGNVFNILIVSTLIFLHRQHLSGLIAIISASVPVTLSLIGFIAVIYGVEYKVRQKINRMFRPARPAMGAVTSSAERSSDHYWSTDAVVGETNPPVVVGTAYRSSEDQPTVSVGPTYPHSTDTTTFGTTEDRHSRPIVEFGDTPEPARPVYPIYTEVSGGHDSGIEIGHTSGPSRPLYPVYTGGSTGNEFEVGHTFGASTHIDHGPAGISQPYGIESGETFDTGRIVYPTETEGKV